MEITNIINMLERDDSLKLSSTPVKGNIPEEEVHQVKMDELFPVKPKVFDDPNLSEELVIIDDKWEIDGQIVEDIIWGRQRELNPEDILLPTSGNEHSEEGVWDIAAWYQPIHYYGTNWGIYIKQDATIRIAQKIYSELDRKYLFGSKPQNPWGVAKACYRAAFMTLYLHEHYHHKVESFGVKLHVLKDLHQKPHSHYLNYKTNIYKKYYMTDDCIEEGLANAHVYASITEKLKKYCHPSIIAATKSLLRKQFHKDPPGYRNAKHLLTESKFLHEQRKLIAQMKEFSLHTKQPLQEFLNAKHLMHPMFNCDKAVFTIVDSRNRVTVPTVGVCPRAMKVKSLVKVATDLGWILQKGRGKGSHYFMQHPQSKDNLVIPLSKREVDKGLLKRIEQILYSVR